MSALLFLKITRLHIIKVQSRERLSKNKIRLCRDMKKY